MSEWDTLALQFRRSGLLSADLAFMQGIYRAVGKGDPQTWQRWREVLRTRLVPSSVDCGECGATGNPAAVFDGYGMTCKHCSAQTPLRKLINHRQFLGAESEQLATMRVGEDAPAAFGRKFGTLISHSNAVVVIDRYAVADAIRDHAKQRQSGLGLLLHHAARASAHVELVVGADFNVLGQKYAPPSISSALRGAVAKPASLRVDVTVLDGATARDNLHDRWLGAYWRADAGVTFSIGKGLGQFSEGTVSQAFSIGRQRDQVAAEQLAMARGLSAASFAW